MSESTITNPTMMLVSEAKKLRRKVEASGEFRIIAGERADLADLAQMTCMSIATIHFNQELKAESKREVVILTMLSIFPSDDIEEALPGFVDALTAYYTSLLAAETHVLTGKRKCCECTIL